MNITHIGDLAKLCYILQFKKVFAHQNTNTNNTSIVGQIVRSSYKRVAHLSWERGYAKSIALCMFCGKLQAIL